MARPTTNAISPFFIVTDVARTIEFYRDKLGFEVTYTAEPEDLYFAVIKRDGAQILVKADHTVKPTPNPTRHPTMRWDAFVYAPDPDALAADFEAHGATFSSPLENNSSGLRGFEITDPDGYVLFFGKPVSE